jgi:predicted amidohydrolase YtcJ
MTELNRLGVTAVMDAGGGFQNFADMIFNYRFI